MVRTNKQKIRKVRVGKFQALINNGNRYLTLNFNPLITEYNIQSGILLHWAKPLNQMGLYSVDDDKYYSVHPDDVKNLWGKHRFIQIDGAITLPTMVVHYPTGHILDFLNSSLVSELDT